MPKPRHTIPPWVFVLLGVLMTVVSAIILQVVIQEQQKRMMTLEMEAETIDSQIDGLWESLLRFERNANTALMLVHHPEGQVDSRSYITTVLGIEDVTTPEQILEAIANKRSDHLGRINDIYEGRVTLERERRDLQQENESLTSLAVFLQIFGLILVLARDITRKRWD